MEAFVQFLVDNPLLLLFLVAGIGYPLGRIQIGGVRLGVAFVLFVGLIIGSLDARIQIPQEIYTLGLILFVYTIGLSNGGVFIEALRRTGFKANLLAMIGMIIIFAVSASAFYVLGIKTSYVSGLLAGSTTSTPSLAAAIEALKHSVSPEIFQQVELEPVIAYSLTYPFGVLGTILILSIFQKIWKIDAQEGKLKPVIQSVTIRATFLHPIKISSLMEKYQWDVTFARHKRGEQPDSLVQGDTLLQAGDLINLVGTPQALKEVIPRIGVESTERIEYDLNRFDRRRIIVSNAEIVGQKLSDLGLARNYDALVTRVRRGDIDFVPHGDTRLAMGDLVIVQAPHDRMDPLAQHLGDSYRSVSEIDVLTFSLGVAMGLLIGLIPIPLPGGVVIRLGVAGGPLFVALFLGAIRRTGPIQWDLPYGANLTLRQIGLVIFLAGIGTNAGYNFMHTLSQGKGLDILLVGMFLTASMSFVVIFIGFRWFKLPFGFMAGLISGLQTNAAVLSFSQDQYGDEQPALGYTTVFPLAMILKIIMAQLILYIK
jgi:putative transport protein